MTTLAWTFGSMLAGAVAADLDRWSNGWAFFTLMGGWAAYGLYLLVGNGTAL